MKKFDLKKLIPYAVAIAIFIAISLIYVGPYSTGSNLTKAM